MRRARIWSESIVQQVLRNQRVGGYFCPEVILERKSYLKRIQKRDKTLSQQHPKSNRTSKTVKKCAILLRLIPFCFLASVLVLSLSYLTFHLTLSVHYHCILYEARVSFQITDHHMDAVFYMKWTTTACVHFEALNFVLHLTACAKRAEAINHSSWYDETPLNQGKIYQKCARRHNRKSDINCTCCNKTSILGQPLCQPVLWA